MTGEHRERLVLEEVEKTREILTEIKAIQIIEQESHNALEFLEKTLQSYIQDPSRPTFFSIQQIPGSGKSTIAESVKKIISSHENKDIRNLKVSVIEFDEDAENFVGRLGALAIRRRALVPTDKHIGNKDEEEIEKAVPDLKLDEIDPELSEILDIVLIQENDSELDETEKEVVKKVLLDAFLETLPDRYLREGTHTEEGKHEDYSPDSDLFLKFARAQYFRRITQEIENGTEFIIGHASAGTLISTHEGETEVRAYANKTSSQIREKYGNQIKIAVCSAAGGIGIIYIRDVIRALYQKAEITAEPGSAISEVDFIHQVFGGKIIKHREDLIRLTSGGSLEVIALVYSLEAKLLKDHGTDLGLDRSFPNLYQLATMERNSTLYQLVYEYVSGSTSDIPFEMTDLEEIAFNRVKEIARLGLSSDPDFIMELIQSQFQKILSGIIQQKLVKDSDPDFEFYGMNDPKAPFELNTLAAKGLMRAGVNMFREKLDEFQQNQPGGDPVD